jgi:hypothetical protein
MCDVMTMGREEKHEDMFLSSREFCKERLSESSLYRLLAERGAALFPDEMFEDLFDDVGRRSVAPRIVATVMVLQRFEGLSDREAVDRFAFDLRWKYAATVTMDTSSFVHTVLVDMRARLRNSETPNRIFEKTLELARSMGLVGRKRVMDSTALYDAVATQDTVTMIRAAIRALLKVAHPTLAAEIRSVLCRDDDYATPGKPACEWDDVTAREALIDALATDGYAAILLLDKRAMEEPVRQAVQLLATVLGQDLETLADDRFAIARRVTPDRVISVVDPEARHGHKTAARGFDGYKGHLAIDPDSEIIVATEVTAGNAGDATAVAALLHDVLEPSSSNAFEVQAFGDASYGTADVVERLEAAGIVPNVKVQPPSAREGMFSQDDFAIDLDKNTVTCPAGALVELRRKSDGEGHADFGRRCADCALRPLCTQSQHGRTVRVHPKHKTLARMRSHQRDPAWRDRYRSTRPKVERKIAHAMRRKHGGRRARVRGTLRVRHDFALLAAALNLGRIAHVLDGESPRHVHRSSDRLRG